MSNPTQSGTFDYEGVVDIRTLPVNLDSYLLIGTSGSVTLNGYFVNGRGFRVGNAFTATVLSTTAVTIADLYGAALPSSAIGLVCNTSGELTYDTFDPDGAVVATLKTNLQTNKANFPSVNSGKSVGFGRV